MDTPEPTAPATPTNITPFNPRPGFRNPAMVSKREMAQDMLKATVLLKQTEQRRATLERFLMAVLINKGAVVLGNDDLTAATGYHLRRDPLISVLEKFDPSKSVFSAEKNAPEPQTGANDKA